MITQEMMDLYIEAECGLVCPFPRLDTIRSHPEYMSCLEPGEFAKMLAEEREYLQRKRDARDKFYKLMREEGG